MAKRFFYGFVFLAVLCLIGSSLTYAEDGTSSAADSMKATCDAKRDEILKTTLPGTMEREEAYRAFMKECPMPKTMPAPLPVDCAGLLKMLNGESTATTNYTQLKDKYRALGCGSTGQNAIQQMTMPYLKPAAGACEELKAKVLAMDPSSQDYAALRLKAGEACRGSTATTPTPPSPEAKCEEAKKKLASMDATSADYANVKMRVGEICAGKKPEMAKTESDVQCIKAMNVIRCKDGTTYWLQNGQAVMDGSVSMPKTPPQESAKTVAPAGTTQKTIGNCRIVLLGGGRKVRMCGTGQ